MYRYTGCIDTSHCAACIDTATWSKREKSLLDADASCATVRRVPDPAHPPAPPHHAQGVLPMKRRSRRSLTMIAVTALALTVAACGGGGSGGAGKDKLTFLSWSGQEVMGPVVKDFEAKHPDIDVEVSYAPPVA